jgi:hypothetical protein
MDFVFMIIPAEKKNGPEDSLFRSAICEAAACIVLFCGYAFLFNYPDHQLP